MRYISRETVAKTAYPWWRYTYLDTGRASDLACKIGRELNRLGANPTADAVDKIIAQAESLRSQYPEGWCMGHVPKCYECEKRVPAVVAFGEGTKFEPESYFLCPACILAAFQLLEES